MFLTIFSLRRVKIARRSNDARVVIVLDLVWREQISMSRGARELGLDRLAFMRLASANGTPVFDLSEEEWNAEVQRIAAR